MFQSLEYNRIRIILEIRCTVQAASASSDTFFGTFAMLKICFFLYRLKLIQCFNFQSLEYIAWLGLSWRSGVLFKLLQPQVTLSLEHFQCSTFICLLRMMLNSMHFFVLYSRISNRLIPILDIRYTVQDHSRSCELSWVSYLEA